MIIIDILITSLFIFGIKFCFSEGQILGKLPNYIKGKLPFKRKSSEKLLKPLLLCPPCMVSVWGTVAYFILEVDMYWLMFILCVTGFNAFLMKYWNW